METPTSSRFAKAFEPIDQLTEVALRQWARALSLLDLVGPDCRPSFSKITTLLVLGVSVYTDTFGLAIAVVVVAAAFGRSTFMAFLNRHTSTAAATTTVTVDAAAVIAAVQGRRDPALGIEASP